VRREATIANPRRAEDHEDGAMAIQWTHTRSALRQFPTGNAAKYLARLVFNGPQIVNHARSLLQEYTIQDDRFKIHMIHYLRQTLPGNDLEPLYEAMLQDIMADKPQLP
jgi:hypothetical protein